MATNEPEAPEEGAEPQEGSDQSGLFLLLGVSILVATVFFVCVISRLGWQSYLDEYGYDGLATAFSGLAFAALWYAIHLQRKELGLQRKELRETRKELKRSADAQGASAKLQEEQIRLQEIAISQAKRQALEKHDPLLRLERRCQDEKCELIIINLGATAFAVSIQLNQSAAILAGNIGSERGFNIDLEEDEKYLEIYVWYETADGRSLSEDYEYDYDYNEFRKLDSRSKE